MAGSQFRSLSVSWSYWEPLKGCLALGWNRKVKVWVLQFCTLNLDTQGNQKRKSNALISSSKLFRTRQCRQSYSRTRVRQSDPRPNLPTHRNRYCTLHSWAAFLQTIIKRQTTPVATKWKLNSLENVAFGSTHKVTLKCPYPSLEHPCLKFWPLLLPSCQWSANVAQLQARSRVCCILSLPLLLRNPLLTAAEMLSASHCTASYYIEFYKAL